MEHMGQYIIPIVLTVALCAVGVWNVRLTRTDWQCIKRHKQTRKVFYIAWDAWTCALASVICMWLGILRWGS